MLKGPKKPISREVFKRNLALQLAEERAAKAAKKKPSSLPKTIRDFRVPTRTA